MPATKNITYIKYVAKNITEYILSKNKKDNCIKMKLITIKLSEYIGNWII